MKRGDIGTTLLFTVKDKAGTIVDLTDASEAKLIMKLGETRLEKAMTVIVPKTNGQVSYVTISGDIPISGSLDMEVRIKFSDGKTFTSSRIHHVVDAKL
jgi:hypothetical protein